MKLNDFRDYYNRTILPKKLDSVLGSEQFMAIRKDVIANASNIVLEIGVGTGRNFPLYSADQVTELYALEPSTEMIVIARKQLGEILFPMTLLQAGAEEIPLEDNSVDTVVSTWTLCSVNNEFEVLKEIKRVLKPNGKFVFVEHGASPNRITLSTQQLITPITRFCSGNCHLNKPIDKLIESAGFSITEMDHPKVDFKPLIYNFRGVAMPDE